MERSEDPVLNVHGLRVDFGPVSAVQQVDFQINPGEIVSLVGESGSGKSVTAAAILGLLPETAQVRGSVHLDGTQILGRSEPELRQIRGARIGMVFQEPSTALNPVKTIGWQLAEALRAHTPIRKRQARDRAIEMLELVGIPEPQRRIEQYPHQLSGGQKQRVVIALALANEPPLIIADEPTTALDVTVQAQILRLLRDLCDRLGTAMLLITHNMAVVATIADRIVVMHEGNVVESGAVTDVFQRPRVDYTRRLLSAVPRMEADRAAAPETENGVGAVLDFADLVVEYPGRLGRPAARAVDGIGLRLRPGEVMGIVGESGSGKSTLGRVAVGLLAPTSGQANILGGHFDTRSRRQQRALRKRIGMVFQDPAASLDPRRPVADSIGEPLLVHDAARGPERRRRVAELMDSVQLSETLADRRPGQLSGGQRQRAGIARALALRPELLVADEPTSALDVSVQAAVLELLVELQQELGFACLFISHDIAVIDRVSDRVAVMQGGRIVETGDPAIVLRSPAAAYTRTLISSVPSPDPRR